MIEALVLSLMDVTEQVRTRERVIAAERARTELAENLNNEIAHRVKNNLAMISGLLQMQALGQKDKESATAMREAVARVQTFAHIHEQMYSRHSQEVDLLVTIERIATTIRDVFAVRGDVHITVSGQSYLCPSRAATNLSVVANELVTNAIKYGAPTKEGQLQINVSIEQRDGQLHIAVYNSGNPVSEQFDPRRQSGMGLRLVWEMITEQYQGYFHLVPHDTGTWAEVVVPTAGLE